MTTRARALGRLPRDLHARERLREAQAAEARAVTAVCTAQAALSGTCAKRDAAVAAAEASVEQAETILIAARSALVDVSGVDRAAVLLGMDRVELRKTLTVQNGRNRRGADA